MYLRDGHADLRAIGGDPRPVPLRRATKFRWRRAQRRNAMAALLAALAVGCSRPRLRDAIRTFARCRTVSRTVAEIDGVLYVDDSKATNPASVVAALLAYDAPDRA